MRRLLCISLLALLAAACARSPRTWEQIASQPALFPDYTDIAIPCNIAPLNFRIDGADRIAVVAVGRARYEFRSRGPLMLFPQKRWRAMLEAEKGGTLDIYVTVGTGSVDRGYRGFRWEVIPEPVDRYMSYRLIEPAYEVWNKLSICERDLERFDERLLGDNSFTGGSCMNCHTSNRAPEPTSFLHLRGEGGGTVYSRAGRVRKIDTATERTAGAVYGEIDSSGRWGIFTTADIRPILHSLRQERMEVFDAESDLILIDFERGTVTSPPGVSGEAWQQTFPCFAPDARTIYFCRAPALPQPDSTRRMRYNLYRISFDPATGRLGEEPELVWDAAAQGLSVSFPKCSPDGRRLLATVSAYGTFPIWHTDTDLCMIDLATGAVDAMEETNGPWADSYHSWSSNGRWIAFASKRDERVYSRPYLAYVYPDGRTGKAFVLPQRDPECYRTTLKSYNIPELYSNPESYDARALGRLFRGGEAERMRFQPYE